MADQTTETVSFGKVIKDAFKELAETAVAFVKAPKALWGVNIPYVLEGLVYFGILTILGKYCSENVQLSDLYSGWVYSGVTGGITLAMLFLGGVSDRIGVRKALILSFILFVAGRATIAMSGTLPLGHGISSPMFFTLIAGLFLMVIAYGLYQPAAYAGVKRYTNPQTAAMGYAVVYGLMNLGAFFSGFISPLTRHHFKNVFPPNGLTAVFWVYAGISLFGLIFTVVVLTKKTDEKAVSQIAGETENQAKESTTAEKSEAEKEVTPKVRINNSLLALFSAIAAMSLALGIIIHNGGIMIASATRYEGLPLVEWIAYIAALLFTILSIIDYLRHRPDHPFRDLRFTFFIFILIPVQTLFAHNWLTLPYYLDRAFKGSMVSHYFEFFSNLNPILIFFLAPLVAGLTAKANVYKMMIYGTFVMAIPTFLLALGPNVPLFLTYVLFMSIGEAMWQPRFLQWIAEIAPEGKVGIYMGIGQFPWFLTKMITGFYSGYFVAKYLPKTGLPHSGQMWFIYGCIAIVSPIALVLAKGWMQKGMKKKQEA
ncbi:MAG: MFS transporter [Acidobacteria bacterium]|nr:MAG: MFS transporter [Acidobacteriota bacterium]